MRKFQTARKIGDKCDDVYFVGNSVDFAEQAASLGALPRCLRSGEDNNCEWFGGMTYANAKLAALTGDNRSAEKSEKYLKEIEAIIHPPTARHRIIDDVTGAVPNIGAYLAGQPMNMRRRVRREDEAAPLAIIIDGATSSAISGDNMAKRGAAILALVRAAASVRPVELYLGFFGLVNSSKHGHAMCGQAFASLFQIETAPLDLSRAAFMLAHPAATRALMYSMMEREIGWNNSSMLKIDQMEKMAHTALPHIQDTLCVPALMYNGADIAADPVAWIKANIETLNLHTVEDGEHV